MPTKTFAVIFDMDGVIADNLKYHKRAWQAFFKRHGLKLTDKFFDEKMNGRTNQEILETIFKRKLTRAEITADIKEKEELYRKIYRPLVKPVPGIVNFLKLLNSLDIKIALATAAPETNVNFILNGTKTRKFFAHLNIVDAENVRRGKPNPEIFLKAAHKLKTPPRQCIVFEDAPLGIMAAKRAGMKVVGVATTYRAAKLHKYKSDLIIKNFNSLKISKLLELFLPSPPRSLPPN